MPKPQNNDADVKVNSVDAHFPDASDCVIKSKLENFSVLELSLTERKHLQFENAKLKWIGNIEDLADLLQSMINMGKNCRNNNWFKTESKKSPQSQRSKIRRWFETRYDCKFDQQFKPVNCKTTDLFTPLINRVLSEK